MDPKQLNSIAIACRFFDGIDNYVFSPGFEESLMHLKCWKYAGNMH